MIHVLAAWHHSNRKWEWCVIYISQSFGSGPFPSVSAISVSHPVLLSVSCNAMSSVDRTVTNSTDAVRVAGCPNINMILFSYLMDKFNERNGYVVYFIHLIMKMRCSFGCC